MSWKNCKRKVLGFLLHHANKRPCASRKSEFYALKTRLLRKYGTAQDCDLQHIQKKCWSCNGTGQWATRTKCIKCYGSGDYEEFWMLLQQYTLGGYSFHVPLGEQIRNRPDQTPTITGYITHESKGHQSREAFLWLTLLTDRKLFADVFLHSTALRSWKQGLPLCMLNEFLYRGKCFVLWEWRVCLRALHTRWLHLWWKITGKTFPEDDIPF